MSAKFPRGGGGAGPFLARSLRRHEMLRLIWLCTVYTCKKHVRRICLYGLKHSGMRLNKVEFTNDYIYITEKRTSPA